MRSRNAEVRALLRRYRSAPALRANLRLWRGAAWDLLYALVRGGVGLASGTLWWSVTAACYLALGLLRGQLALGQRRSGPSPALRHRLARRTAWLLLPLSLPMDGMILLLVRQGAERRCPDWLLYLSAAYSFYAVICACLRLLRRREGDPVLLAAGALNLLAALLSILCLQTALIARFSHGAEGFRRLMDQITGAAVCTAAPALAVRLLTRFPTTTKGGFPMAPTDSKYFRTAERMDQALLRLLERKDFPLITVKELCREAEVSRSTFYLHYETVADLLSETADTLLRQFLDSMGHRPDDFLQGIAARPLGELRLVTEEYLVPYLSYLRDHRRVFQTALAHADIFRLEEAYAQLFRHVFTPILDRFQVPEGEREYLVAFYLHGLLAVISQWLRRDCPEDVETLAAFLSRHVPQGG